MAKTLEEILAVLVGVVFGKIATHPGPHLDEIVAMWLLKHFGDKLFPGVSKARIVFWGHGGMTPDGRPVEEYMREGILPVGVAGSLLDEHPKGDGERAKQKTCAAMLTAELLGVAHDPALQQMLAYVLDKDTHATAAPFDLAHMVKCMHAANPKRSKLVINAIWQMLDAKYHEQMEFHVTAKRELEKTGRWFDIQRSGGTLRVMLADTGCSQVHKFARTEQGGNCAITIQRDPGGHVQILTKHQEKLCLDGLARMIRWEEQAAAGEVTITNWRELSAEGTVAGWHYHRHGRMLLNGSATANKVPPTKLPIEEIARLVRIAFSPKMFEPGREEQCLAGHCSDTDDNPCLQYNWGRTECQAIRRAQRRR